MGISFEYIKQYKYAIKCYDKAIKLNPDDHHAYHNKALALASLGYDELFLEYYDKAMELNPKRYEDMYYEAMKESDEEMEQHINQGGVLN